MPDTGNEWRKFCVVPRSNPLSPLVCTLLNRGGNRRAFRQPGEGGDRLHCTVEPSPSHIRCRHLILVVGGLNPYWFPLPKGVTFLEIAVGAVFAPTRFSLVRISIRDLVADRNPY